VQQQQHGAVGDKEEDCGGDEEEDGGGDDEEDCGDEEEEEEDSCIRLRTRAEHNKYNGDVMYIYI